MKFPKVLFPSALLGIEDLMGELSYTIRLLKSVVDGFKDGVGADDIKKCGELAERLEKIYKRLAPLVS